jgi:hypothetical protein
MREPDELVGLVRVIGIVLVVFFGYVLASEWGGGVVRASGPAVVPEVAHGDTSCCLIPANRGLRGVGQ